MKRVNSPGHVNNRYVEEDINTNQPPTTLQASAFNALQEEICSVIEETGETLDANDNAQLLAAIRVLIGEGSGITPVGGIIMWSGSTSAIPTHWQLCNGTNGTPDLRGKFIVGASASGGYAVGATGGSADATLPAHSHGITQTAHSHTGDITKYGESGGDDNPWGSGNAASSEGTYSFTTGSANANITIQSTGDDPTNANLPPYYALAYIQRIS